MNTIFAKEKLIPLIQEVKSLAKPEQMNTFECQFTLKNYDFQKDVRFDSNCKLPYTKEKKKKF